MEFIDFDVRFLMEFTGFSTSHFLQKPIRQRLSYSTKLSLAISSVIGSSATYFVVRNRIHHLKEDSGK